MKAAPPGKVGAGVLLRRALPTVPVVDSSEYAVLTCPLILVNDPDVFGEASDRSCFWMAQPLLNQFTVAGSSFPPGVDDPLGLGLVGSEASEVGGSLERGSVVEVSLGAIDGVVIDSGALLVVSEVLDSGVLDSGVLDSEVLDSGVLEVELLGLELSGLELSELEVELPEVDVLELELSELEVSGVLDELVELLEMLAPGSAVGVPPVEQPAAASSRATPARVVPIRNDRAGMSFLTVSMSTRAAAGESRSDGRVLLGRAAFGAGQESGLDGSDGRMSARARHKTISAGSRSASPGAGRLVPTEPKRRPPRPGPVGRIPVAIRRP